MVVLKNKQQLTLFFLFPEKSWKYVVHSANMANHIRGDLVKMFGPTGKQTSDWTAHASREKNRLFVWSILADSA